MQHTISQDVFGHHKNSHMDTSFQNEVNIFQKELFATHTRLILFLI